MPTMPRHVLFLAEGQLGDLLLLTPAIRAAKTSFSGSEVSVVVFHRRGATDVGPDPKTTVLEDRTFGTAAVFADNPHVDRVVNVFRFVMRSKRGLGKLRAEAEVVRMVRRFRCDVAICTFPEDRFALLAYASGARIRVGQEAQGLSWLLSRTPRLDRAGAGVLRYYCDLVVAAGAHVQSMETEYHVPEPAKQWVKGAFAREGIHEHQHVIAVHPGASGDYKIWPPERYAQLIDRLCSRGKRVVLCRGSADGPIVDAIQMSLASSIPLFDSGHDIGKLGALLERCNLCITNDSGPRHLAVAVRTPSLALFRQHHGREWGVYEESAACRTLQSAERCPVCPQGECKDLLPPGERFGSWCMRSLGVEEVLGEAERMLSVGQSRAG